LKGIAPHHWPLFAFSFQFSSTVVMKNGFPFFPQPAFPSHFKLGQPTDADISFFVFLRDLIAVNWPAKQLMLLCFIAIVMVGKWAAAWCSGEGRTFNFIYAKRPTSTCRECVINARKCFMPKITPATKSPAKSSSHGQKGSPGENCQQHQAITINVGTITEQNPIPMPPI